MTHSFWRKWHRWIAFPASLFLLFAAITGVLVAFTEFFGAEETQREALRKVGSPIVVNATPATLSPSLKQAFESAARLHGNAPVDKVEMQFKGDRPTVTLFTGKPGGGEDRKLVFNASDGSLLSDESYADKPFLYRLHSGEAFGDGGLVV